jgi:hypothetical protein
MKKKPEYQEFSAWDDLKFTLGGLLIWALPIALVVGLFLLVF